MNTAWRTENPGYLMYTATGLCIRHKLGLLHHAGFTSLTEAQMSLFHNIDLEGTRLTEIADRAMLTKQSMVELVNKAEKLGFVTRLSDPADKRAKIVTLSASGRRLIEALEAAIAATERKFVSVCGAPFVEELRVELGRYAGLGNAPCPMRSDPGVRRNGSGRLLALAARRFAGEALGAVHEHACQQVTEADLALFRNLDLQGSRLTQLALRARMTKQSMRELVDRAEVGGFVERDSDPGDARAKVIRFTDVGLAFLDQMRIGLDRAELDLGRMTTNGFVGRLKSGLADYVRRSPGGVRRIAPLELVRREA